MQAMDEVWGEGDQVQVIHPAAACIAGRELVRKPAVEQSASIKARPMTHRL